MLQCLKLLLVGHFQELFDELASRPPTRPSHQAHQADMDEWNDYTHGLLNHDVAEDLLQCVNPGAQKAADCDNLHAAFQCLDHLLPVAMNTDAAIDTVKQKI